MRILVISDTHIPISAKQLPPTIKKEAKASDLCLHAGDFISYSIFETLNSWKKTHGVRGNMDEDETCKKLPTKKIIKLEKVTLGLMHGGGHPKDLISYINKDFSQKFDEIDIFVFGHSHYPLDKVIQKKVYFNPGSPTDKVYAPYCSFGILEINGRDIKRRIVKIG